MRSGKKRQRKDQKYRHIHSAILFMSFRNSVSGICSGEGKRDLNRSEIFHGLLTLVNVDSSRQ